MHESWYMIVRPSAPQPTGNLIMMFLVYLHHYYWQTFIPGGLLLWHYQPPVPHGLITFITSIAAPTCLHAAGHQAALLAPPLPPGPLYSSFCSPSLHHAPSAIHPRPRFFPSLPCSSCPPFHAVDCPAVHCIPRCLQLALLPLIRVRGTKTGIPRHLHFISSRGAGEPA